MKLLALSPLLAAVLGSAHAAAAPANEAPLPKTVTFNAHIRPIFSDTCFACHGFDAKKREAGLRLDTPDGGYAKLKDSDERAIVPFKPDESAIVKRIFSTVPDEVMPPPTFHKDLTARQKALIREWIAQGAKYEEHWAFAPIAKPPVPAPIQAAGNPIDAFIRASLESEKLAPSPQADKATLLRRLSLDLIGLPPSPAEVEAFLADASPDAYDKQVERLLASPHYGERMAVPWLDVVRFADTVGFHGDQNQRVFPYRDYVIDAFNRNKPFDQFTVEQLAGDLLPNPSDEQRIATGFLRLNLMTREGGAQPQEYLAKYMGNRIRAVGAAWLGLTTGCAECHDHKFDPITTRDYYSLGAFFADIREWGVYADYGYTPNKDLPGWANESTFPPEIHTRNAAQMQRLETLRTAVVDVLAPLKTAQDETAFQAWLRQTGAFLTANPSGWQTLPATTVTASQGTPNQLRADHATVFNGPPKKGETLTLDFVLPEAPIRAIRLEAVPDASNGGRDGRQPNGKFALAPSFAVVADGKAEPLKPAWSQADRRTPHGYKNGDSASLLEPEWRSAPALWEDPQDAASQPQTALYHLGDTLPAAAGRVLRVTLASADLGGLRISVTPFGDAVPGDQSAVRKQLAAAFGVKPEARSETHHRELAAAWIQSNLTDAKRTTNAVYKKLREEILSCRAGYAYSLVAQAVPAEKLRPVHVLPRGNWMAPADEVKPAVPAFLAHASVRNDGARLTRLDLARWLMAKENPLTARHFTNRLWKQFFGKGLSNVLDDLGNQGEWPSHPQLLDWLATEFRESNWDIKHMVGLIVTSQTYRQQASSRQDVADKDPYNRLLAEQSARRLDAEFVRDNALQIGGLLDAGLIGGPSVRPYQPAGYYANINFPERDYYPSIGSDQYRRGVYTHWQRTFMHPMLAAFDAPSREECTADRFQSNSPQQALTLLNDPSFVEAARGFALRLLLDEPSAPDAERIRYAIKLALAREAKPAEMEALGKFLVAQRALYQSKPDDAKALLAVGQPQPGAAQPPVELAAWTQLCRVILNLHETITRY